MTRDGGCLCGGVRYRLDGAGDSIGACHCQMCRRFSGGVHLSIRVPAGGAVFEGAENIATCRSSDRAERGVCRICGSSLFCRITAPGRCLGDTHLCAGTLDGMEGLTPGIEVFIDARPDCHAFAGERRAMTETEVLAMVAGNSGEDAP